MMRRSGVKPAVKRWKLSWVMLRRAASGHIAATQPSKLPAASRIAAAVIKGWPEAPSSPLQGCGPLAEGACAGAGEPELPLLSVPVNRLSRKFSGLPDCASAEPDTARADATIAALVPVLKAASMTFRRIVISS